MPALRRYLPILDWLPRYDPGLLTRDGLAGNHLFGDTGARSGLDELKAWLGIHNAAVMAALFLVFGVDLIAKGLPPLTS